MEHLLKMAKVEIHKAMQKIGRINDSDNSDRFLDNLAKELAENEILKGNEDIKLYYEKETEIEELQEILLAEIKDKIMDKYKIVSECDKSGTYTAYYYNELK